MSARGTTLVEALTAITVLAIMLAGVIPGLMTFARTNSLCEQRTGAIQAAQIVLETLRISNIAGLPTTGSNSPEAIDVGDYEFEVVTHYCRVPSLCSSGSRHLTVEVSYGGRSLYTVETVFTDFRY